MKTDYPELEGKKVKYVDGVGSETQIKIIRANYHVGITGVDVNNPPNKVICLNADIHKKENGWTPEYYRKFFYSCIRMIKEGAVYNSELRKCYPPTMFCV